MAATQDGIDGKEDTKEDTMENTMEKWSLIVAIVGVVASIVVALVAAAWYAGGLRERVTILEGRGIPQDAIESAREAVRRAGEEAAAGLQDVLGPSAILPVYSHPTNLPEGWVYCGEAETPDFDGRFLVGTRDGGEVGQMIGAVSHTHAVSITSTGETNGEFRFQSESKDYADNIPDGGGVSGQRNWYHDHLVQGDVAGADNLPPAVNVMFLCRSPG